MSAGRKDGRDSRILKVNDNEGQVHSLILWRMSSYGNVETIEDVVHGGFRVLDLRDDRDTSSRTVGWALIHATCAHSR